MLTAVVQSTAALRADYGVFFIINHLLLRTSTTKNQSKSGAKARGKNTQMPPCLATTICKELRVKPCGGTQTSSGSSPASRPRWRRRAAGNTTSTCSTTCTQASAATGSAAEGSSPASLTQERVTIQLTLCCRRVWIKDIYYSLVCTHGRKSLSGHELISWTT